ncbi:helix-turn-helix domain-containing protein [Paenibacillus sp. S150]|uniref:helix-turn-helix domain-containing protein n=1 Tax=Paenibacillus sp. S150 TaxID=2749826 RepID=UPI001C59A946|nr:helix-turn-helix domain-containing protein [Paenibacillus sp. S150]MBW4083609.1 helix-turn-helix domain-containing protein [Paenibacillus sp. S150]
MSDSAYKSTSDLPAVLSAKEVQEILGIGERQTYELLNSEQFHIVRVGRMIKVSKDVFLKWLEG